MHLVAPEDKQSPLTLKSNWSFFGATEHTKERHGYFDWLYPKTVFIKNRYYDKKVRESLEIDMVVVRYGQNKVLNRNNGNFVKTNAWKPLFTKIENTPFKFDVILY